MSLGVAPPASRHAPTFLPTCSICARRSPLPTTSPTASRATCPATTTQCPPSRSATLVVGGEAAHDQRHGAGGADGVERPRLLAGAAGEALQRPLPEIADAETDEEGLKIARQGDIGTQLIAHERAVRPESPLRSTIASAGAILHRRRAAAHALPPAAASGPSRAAAPSGLWDHLGRRRSGTHRPLQCVRAP